MWRATSARSSVSSLGGRCRAGAQVARQSPAPYLNDMNFKPLCLLTVALLGACDRTPPAVAPSPPAAPAARPAATPARLTMTPGPPFPKITLHDWQDLPQMQEQKPAIPQPIQPYGYAVPASAAPESGKVFFLLATKRTVAQAHAFIDRPGTKVTLLQGDQYKVDGREYTLTLSPDEVSATPPAEHEGDAPAERQPLRRTQVL